MRIVRRCQGLEEIVEIRVDFARRHRVPIRGGRVGACLGLVEDDAGSHVEQVAHGCALIGSQRDLWNVVRYERIDIETAVLSKNAANEPDDRFRGRHQDVRRVFGIAVGICLVDDLAVLQDDDRIRRRRLKERRQVEGRTISAREFEIFERLRLGGEGPNVLRVVLDPIAGNDLRDVVKCPAIERRGAPVRDGRVFGRSGIGS